MDILLIGNGFDLEHGLPTKYSDFLTFCQKIKPIYLFRSEYQLYDVYSEMQYEQEHLVRWRTADSIKASLKDACQSRKVKKDKDSNLYIATDDTYLNELHSLVAENAWLEYFEKRASSIGENWIDFESEISHVVKTLDYVQDHTPPGGVHEELPEPYNSCLVSIQKAAHFSFFNYSNNHTKALQQLTNHLDSELNRFIRAFEIYLSVFVNSIPVERTCADIEHLLPDCVLSFNYSNTYKSIYGHSREISYDFIHGKADVKNTLESCNMVLGIDEYLDGSNKQEELDFLTFKKYYQRIYKSTDNAYLDWIDKIKAHQGIAHTLYIFGHSLDKTDKDVLEKLICNNNVQTKIYYYREYEHDKRTLGKLIKNLVRIMGPDELIRRTGGSHRTIEFIPQTLRK